MSNRGRCLWAPVRGIGGAGRRFPRPPQTRRGSPAGVVGRVAHAGRRRRPEPLLVDGSGAEDEPRADVPFARCASVDDLDTRGAPANLAADVVDGGFTKEDAMADKLILVTGATGKQGGATLRYLAKGGGFKLRALTRKPDGDAAKALAALGAEIVQGDLDDAPSLERALAGAWGVYAVQNTWEAGVEKEEEQGKRIAKLAREKGVQRYVYASVGSAHKKTGIPHFDNKFRVEETVKALGFPSYAIIRPVFFMENLLSPWFLNGDKLVTTLPPNVKLQMIAADDIGKYGAKAFAAADQLKNVDFDIAGDAVTMPEAAAGVSQILGKTITYQPIPIAAVRQNSEDMALMLEWFERTGYSADIAGNEKRLGIHALTFAEWIRTQRS
jgi:uncharacterized protein YbjT (DUF2867 family)